MGEARTNRFFADNSGNTGAGTVSAGPGRPQAATEGAYGQGPSQANAQAHHGATEDFDKPLAPPPESELKAGSVIAGKYRLTARLGEGGMGSVFMAIQEPLGRTVVVKVIRKDLAHDPEYRTRFVKEAKAIASLSHPNVVAVYDFGVTQDGITYLAMESLRGGTLAAILDREGALSERRALSLMTGIVRGLAEVHALGIIHRDLKPENIFVTTGATLEGETAKVLDFGLAKDVKGGGADQSVIVGTPGYMAPEHAQGKPLSPASDVYALGLIWWELLVGKPPYADEAQSAHERMLKQVVMGVPPPSRKTSRPLMPGHEETLMSLLAKNPDDRRMAPPSSLRCATSWRSRARARMRSPRTRRRRRKPPARVCRGRVRRRPSSTNSMTTHKPRRASYAARRRLLAQCAQRRCSSSRRSDAKRAFA